MCGPRGGKMRICRAESGKAVGDRQLGVQIFVRLGVRGDRVARLQEASRLVDKPPHSSAILRGLDRTVYGGLCPRVGWTREVSSLWRHRGEVFRPIGVVGAGIAGHVGIYLRGCESKLSPNSSLVEGSVIKKCVCAGVRWQIS
jgi:hypothetical protein